MGRIFIGDVDSLDLFYGYPKYLMDSSQKKGRPLAALLDLFVLKILELSTLWQAGAKLGAGYTLLFAANFPVGFTCTQ